MIGAARHTGPRFVPRAGAIDELARSSELESGIRALLEDALIVARSIAPIRSGNYAAGLHVEFELTPDGWVGYLIGDDFKTRWIELGTGPNRYMPGGFPAMQPIRNACEAVGIELRGGPA